MNRNKFDKLERNYDDRLLDDYLDDEVDEFDNDIEPYDRESTLEYIKGLNI